MERKIYLNLLMLIIVCLYQPSLTANSFTEGIDIISQPTTIETDYKESPGTITIDNITNESCTGEEDGSIAYTISGLGTATTITVVLGQGSNILQSNLSVTGGTVSDSFMDLAPGSYFMQYLANNSDTGSLNGITVEAGGATIQLVADEPACNGDANGSITVNATGGVAPYEYSIGSGRFQSVNVFGSLAAGSYTFQVKDATGCITSETIQLTEPDPVAIDILTLTPPTCNGGSNGWIAVQASGGDGNYEYSFDGGTTFSTTASLTGLSAGNYSIVIRDGNSCSIAQTPTLTEPTAVTSSLVGSTDAICFNQSNGTVTLDASGGTGTYSVWFQNSLGGGFLRSFTVNSPITGIEPGTYTLQVNDDNGCQDPNTISVTITEPTQLEANSSINAGVTTNSGGTLLTTICNGTTADITISATGGTAPYEYSIDGTNYVSTATFSNLGPGVYEAHVRDANGCTDQVASTRTIAENDPISFNVTTQDASCFGLSDGRILTSNVQGGSGTGYTYSIDGVNFQSSMDFIDLAAGSYTVTIKDFHGCIGTASATISEPVESVLSVNVLNQVSCLGGNDGSIEASITNTTGTVSYVLNSGTPQTSTTFTGLAAGSYTLEATHSQSNCISSATFTITEPATALAATVNVTDVSCNGDSDGEFTIAANGGVAPYTYSIDGNNFGTSSTFSGLQAGSYTATVKDANDCTITLPVSITEPAAISATYQALAPSCIGDTDGKININLASGGTAPLKIRLQGTSTLDFSISNLAPGDYDVEMVDANGCTLISQVTVPEAAPLTADVTVDSNASGCGNSDGAFTLSNPTKGTQAIPMVEYSIDGQNYQSSPSFTGLNAGIYTVNIRDITPANQSTGNCEGTVSVTITEPSGITATVAQSNLSCNGGSDGAAGVTNVAGGTAPYEYSIDGITFGSSPNFTNLSAGSYNITVKDASGCTSSYPVSLTEPGVLAATLTPSDINCNGAGDGSVSLNISGGTAPYYWLDISTFGANNFQTINGTTATYNAVAGSRTGNDAVIVDANGCLIQLPFTINEPAPLAASITNVTDVTCNGGTDGTITITATGGTAPYEVTADGTQYFPLASDGVVPGIGAITIANITVRDANGCDIVIPGFTVNEPDPIMADVIASAALCNGDSNGSITITPTTTTNSSFEYSIDGTNFSANDTFNQLSPGSYTVTVRETGTNCENTFNTTVSEPDILEANPSAVDVTCNGQEDGQIIGSAMGGTAPYEYSIDGGTTYQTEDFMGLDIGSYTVTVRDANGCTVSKTVTIAEPTVLDLSITATTDVSCNGVSDGSATETVTGGILPYTYSLDAQNFNSTVDLTTLSAGSYTLTVKDANDCESSATFTINEPAEIVPTVSASSDVSCNGLTDGSFTVTATGGDGTFMYSLDGTNFSNTNSFTNLAAGSYTVTVQDGSGCTATVMHTVTEPAVINLQFEFADITCTGAEDGQIAGIATGGTSPYTYSIDGTNFQSTAFSGLAAGNYTLTVKDANDCSTTAMVTISEPDVLGSIITSTTDVDCNGNSTGSAVLVVTGGSTPYSYSLDGSTFNNSLDLTSLSADAYTVTIRDANSCETTTSFTITEPDVLGVSLGMVNDTSCNGASDGSISVAGAGGTAPYEYAIDGTTFGTADTFGSLAAGSYTITLQDANGCTATVAATVAEPAALALTFTTADISCNGGADGEITPATTGGAAPYEYSLDGTNFQSGAFSGQAAGTYTLTVRDGNGCTATASVTLTEPLALSGTTAVTDILCFGDSDGSITVTAAGGTAPYEYSTDGSTFQSGDSFSALAAGSYTVTVRDANSCTVTVAATIAEPTELTISANVINDNTISVTASGGTAPYEYALDNGTFQTAGTFSGLANGDYSTTVRDANGCTVSTSSSLVITGDDDPFTPITISAYPNPVSDYLTFSRLSAGDQIRLVSLNGNSLDLTLITEDKEAYRKDISGIRQKVFLAIVVSKDGKIKLNQKVMKKE